MREAYHDLLDDLVGELAEMCDHVRDALADATTALLDVDLQLSEAVITGDLRVDELYERAEDSAAELLTLQAPVSADLRVIVAAIHSARDVARMGDLALHIARAARRRHPRPVLPDEVAGHFAEMGRVGCTLADKASRALRSRDLRTALELESDDDVMDQLHKRTFDVLIDPAWEHGISAAIDVALLTRFYERYADHAVAVARRIVYTVTGHMPGRRLIPTGAGPVGG